MKKIILLVIFIFPLATLSGCSFIFSLYPNSNSMFSSGEILWKNKYTKEQLSSSLYNLCFSGALNSYLMKNHFSLSDISDRDEVYKDHGQCLYDYGYVFTASPLSTYCYHESNEKECKAFNNYRN